MTPDIGHQFMEQTRHPYLSVPDQQTGTPPPPVVAVYDALLPRVELPSPAALALPPRDLRELVTRRRSLRRYSAAALSLPELSFLLWCTQGIEQMTEANTLRTVPSAGARHPLETAVLVNRVAGVDPALYAYEAAHHRLVELRRGPDLADRLAAGCCGQAFVKHSAAAFIWVAVPYRTTWRYAERGFRYLHLDAGHVCQNLYLAAEAIGAGACAIAAFDDEALGDYLALDPQEALVIYVATVGKRPALA